MKPGTSPPISARGIVVPFIGPMEPVCLNDAGEQLDEPMPALASWLQTCPYRSVVSVHWPAHIGYVLPLLDNVFPLPDIVVVEMAATLARGHAILLLSDDGPRRDRVKAALYAMQTIGGCA